MTDADAREVADFLFGLADPTRLRIARALAAGEVSLTPLAAALAVPRVNVSKHLLRMLRAGAVTRRKAGRFIQFALAGAVVSGGVLTLAAHGVTFRMQLDEASAGPEGKVTAKKGKKV